MKRRSRTPIEKPNRQWKPEPPPKADTLPVRQTPDEFFEEVMARPDLRELLEKLAK